MPSARARSAYASRKIAQTRSTTSLGLVAAIERLLVITTRRTPAARIAGASARTIALEPTAITTLIDRLERKGFVRRERDSADRRRVIVRPDAARLAELDQLFGAIQASFAAVLDTYSGEQLATIVDFLTRAAEYSRGILARLDQGGASATNASEANALRGT